MILDNGHTISELDALEWQLLSKFSSYDFADTGSFLAHGFEDSNSSLSPADLESLEQEKFSGEGQDIDEELSGKSNSKSDSDASKMYKMYGSDWVNDDELD